MTLAVWRAFAQTAIAANDDLSVNTTSAIDGKLIRPADGQAIQNTISLLRHQVNVALEHGTEVEVPRADSQTTHVLGDRPR